MPQEYLHIDLYFSPDDPDQVRVFNCLKSTGRKKTAMITSIISSFFARTVRIPLETVTPAQIQAALALYSGPGTVPAEPVIVGTVNIPGQAEEKRSKKKAPRHKPEKQERAEEGGGIVTQSSEPSAGILEDIMPEDGDLDLLEGLSMF